MDSSPEERFRYLTSNRSDRDDDDYTARELEGVEAVYTGRYNEAVAIFEEIEAAKPGRYSTAANLGTAYELQGNLDLALVWIATGIRRNPTSHRGSEWLHVEILKARIKLKEEPDYLVRNHIIKLPDSLSKSSLIRLDDQDLPVDQVNRALNFQLVERAYLVKPKDPIMADLLYTYGVIEAHTKSLESASKLLELSRDYGYKDTKKVDEMLKHYARLILFRKVRYWAWVLLGVAAFVAFLVCAYRKKWFFLSRAAQRRYELSLRKAT